MAYIPCKNQNFRVLKNMTKKSKRGEERGVEFKVEVKNT